MKLFLTTLALLVYSHSASAVELNCVDQSTNQSFTLTADLSTGLAKVKVYFEDQVVESFVGTISAKVIGGKTRVTGATSLSVNGFDNTRNAHTIQVSLLSFDDTSAQGHAAVKTHDGSVYDTIIVGCTGNSK